MKLALPSGWEVGLPRGFDLHIPGVFFVCMSLGINFKDMGVGMHLCCQEGFGTPSQALLASPEAPVWP